MSQWYMRSAVSRGMASRSFSMSQRCFSWRSQYRLLMSSSLIRFSTAMSQARSQRSPISFRPTKRCRNTQWSVTCR